MSAPNCTMHSGVSETSRQTYREIRADLQPKELKIIAAFRGDARLRMTRQRIAAVTNMPLSSVCGRVNRLLEHGQLIELGHIREPETNKPRALVGLATSQHDLFT